MCEEEKVNRCECLGKTFAKLKEQGSLDDAIALGAGQECEGCLPYLKLAYASGCLYLPATFKLASCQTHTCNMGSIIGDFEFGFAWCIS